MIVLKVVRVWQIVSLLIASLILIPAYAAPAEEQQPEADVSPGQVELEPITVTAEKREKSVQEIPGSVSVFSGAQIEDFGFKTTPDLVSMTPNLYVTQTGNAMMTTFAAMRGVTGSMTGIPALGFYVDDVYYTGLDISMFDVERIEVLRGPQGTLYGRNSEAGVVNVVTRKPSNTWEGSLGADVGAYDSYEMKGSVSGPIVDNLLAFRAAVRYYESDGYFKNQFDDSDDAGRVENIDGRFSLAATPSDKLDMNFVYDLQRYDSPKYANFAPLDGGDLRREIDVDYPGEARKDADGASLRTELDLGGMRLVSVTSGRREDYYSANDIDFTPLDLMTMTLSKDVGSFAEELRLLSDAAESPLQWLGGLFFLVEDDDRKYDTWMNFMNMGMGMPGETLTLKSGTETLGIALFGEATYTFLDRLKVTLGLRYDREQKDFDYTQTPGGPVLAMMGYVPDSGSRDDVFDAWLPKAAVSYQISEQVMPYVSVSRGFRSGGFNDKENVGSAYDPEFTWNYELGAKTSWMENRLQVNAALFYIDWSDMQVEVLTAGGTSVFIDNAGRATSKGAELDLIARPLRGLEIIAGASFTDAKYDDYTQGVNVYDGSRVIDSPEYTMNIGATYRFLNGIFVNALYTHYGEVHFDPANTKSQESYGIASARIGYEGKGFDVYLYCRNIFDEEYATRAFEVNDVWYGRSGEPRVVGVNARVYF
jgi:iron complex outermembrane receptor protein